MNRHISGTGSLPVRSASRRQFLVAGVAGGAGLFLAGCTSQPSQQQATRWGVLYLTIARGVQFGQEQEWSVYVPANFSIPSHSTVDASIVNFDHPHTLPADQEQYTTVKGTVGNTVSIQPITITDPNAEVAPVTTVKRIDIATIAHTFTVDDLGLNVPIVAGSRTTFTLQTGDAGVHLWKCMVACPNPPNRAGANSGQGDYMLGKVVVADPLGHSGWIPSH